MHNLQDLGIRGQAVSDQCLPALIKYIREYDPKGGPRKALWDVLVRIEPERIAKAILSAAIHVPVPSDDDDEHDDATERAAMERIGLNLEREYRLVRGRALRAWDLRCTHWAGAWGIDALMKAVPGMFERVLEGPDLDDHRYYLILSQTAQDIAEEVLWACVRANPTHLPATVPPNPWTSESRVGQWGEIQRLVKCRPNSLQMRAVRKALAQESRPWLDAINKLEAVAYRVNEPMLKFVRESYGLATADKPHGLDFLFHDRAIRAWRWDPKTKKRRRVLVADVGDRNKGGEYMFRTDMLAAQELLNRSFYVPMNFDMRGRIYPIPNFNFTRGDHIRCLFEFAEGKPLGELGLYWLKVHTANCASGFDNCRPGDLTFVERVRWVDDNINALKKIGRLALECAEIDDLLIGVSDRFQFVRACIELFRADNNPHFESRLPLLFDCSSSGFQQYCLMTRDGVGGREVNLVPGLPPQDVYRKIADLVSDPNFVVGWRAPRPGVYVPIHVAPAVHSLLTVQPNHRGLVKKVMVPRMYGGRDIRETLLREPWFRERPRVWLMTDFGMLRPRGPKGPSPALADLESKQNSRTAKAAYRCLDAIEAAAKELLPHPFRTMDFLSKLAALLAKKRKPLAWTTPAGFPWQSRYHMPRTDRPTFWIAGRPVRTTITVGDLPEMMDGMMDGKKRRPDKARDAAAPNFIHGLDAAHMQLVALRAEVPMMGIHDCFGCLAADAYQFRAMVHETLSQMYLDHPDVLGELMESIRLWPADRAKLPALPKYGTLDIKGVRNAIYITS